MKKQNDKKKGRLKEGTTVTFSLKRERGSDDFDELRKSHKYEVMGPIKITHKGAKNGF